jgi:hypothetical protein
LVRKVPTASDFFSVGDGGFFAFACASASARRYDATNAGEPISPSSLTRG